MAEGGIGNTEELRLNKNIPVQSKEGLRPEVKIGRDVPERLVAVDPSVPEGPNPQKPVEYVKSAEEIKDLVEKSKGLDMPPESNAVHRNGFRKWLRRETPKFQSKPE